MQLHRKFKDEIEIDDSVYEINASFDVILKILKLLNDKRIHEVARLGVGLKLFLGDPLEHFEFEHRVEIFQKICEMYIELEKPKLDRLGEPVPSPKGQDNDQVLDYEQDAEYIYASFMQAYGIDLIDQQGKLHWNKFKALLNGLPKGTKVVEVVSIRSWKPSDDKKKRNTAMRELQETFRLKRKGE
jgi:hypothetical protein